MAPDPSSEPDPERLKALEDRLAARRKAVQVPVAEDRPLSQAEMGWRMVYELVAGLGIGFGIGYGLDVLFGTLPWMMLVFTLCGFAAGVRVMMRTAQEMNKASAGAQVSAEKDNSRG